MNKVTHTIRIAAIADIHVTETSQGMYHEMFTEISERADVLAICGDLTRLGLISEVEVLIKELAYCSIPIVLVLGNHDYESNKQADIVHMLQDKNIHVLHGTEYIFEKDGKKYGFTGVKGFGGGFRPSMWGRFGEREQKEFYDAVASEVQQLEIGLDQLTRYSELEKIIVLLHFAPIRETLHGELAELYPFLGSTRLEEVIDRYDVSAVFHGHAHFGYWEGKTAKGIPVYNVAYPLMKKLDEKKPYRIVEL